MSRFAVEQLERRRLLSVAPSLAVSGFTLTEGNAGAQNARVTVSLSHSSRKAVSVNFRTEDGSAAAGADYQATFGTLNFARGETSKTIAVPIYGDRIVEPNESFSVILSGAVRANIYNSWGYVTIIDDEPRITIGGAAAVEGNAGTTLFNFAVGLSAAAEEPVTVNYATADYSATTSGSDYLATSGTLTFAPGETAKTITVTVLGDSTAEGDEGFYVILGGASANASMSNGLTGYGSIQDDDGYYDNYDWGSGGGGGDYWSYWPGYYWY